MGDVWHGNWMRVQHDPLTGCSLWMTAEDGKYVFRFYQPMEPIFAANHEAEMATHGRPFGDYVRIASVPLNLAYNNGLNEAIEQKDRRFIRRFMNDPDMSKFRTSRGRM